MSISIITPHFNDFEGIKQTHNCLSNQDSEEWEWIIVDDCSDGSIKNSLKEYFNNKDCSNIQLIFNELKTNGSVCRNIGVDHSSYDQLVFLDSDDIISKDFVANRLVNVEEFIVYKNYNLLKENGENSLVPGATFSSNYLNEFLRANFLWQTTAILWNKSFLLKIGKFNKDLKRLQDIELSIRALFIGTKYKVVDNKVDFFYCVFPIDPTKRTLKLICDSVDYLVTSINLNYKLNNNQKSLLKGYYFLCVRYFVKSQSKKEIARLHKSLKLFYLNKHLSFLSYFFGIIFIKLFKYNIISVTLFMKLNRYFYK